MLSSKIVKSLACMRVAAEALRAEFIHHPDALGALGARIKSTSSSSMLHSGPAVATFNAFRPSSRLANSNSGQSPVQDGKPGSAGSDKSNEVPKKETAKKKDGAGGKKKGGNGDEGKKQPAKDSDADDDGSCLYGFNIFADANQMLAPYA
ncbi:hypothetical protein K490DRAFT_54163 [Saccharata proteae CBS 121410]|uniref:Uncharacterized protein n=1 Tax=Saccharata proteae CBS 121410 TaxID=1314787 RepID=A0A9P4LZM9_9PEZI|nr:hypothetical protein K490DRAFT_54163 [Saccharata proteae CBS 121410]